MSAPTPGPWSIGCPNYGGCSEVGIHAGDDWVIADICGDIGDPAIDQKANAHLIAASPDMADALRQWQHAEETGDDAELANARKSRDMALAKARGEGAES